MSRKKDDVSPPDQELVNRYEPYIEAVAAFENTLGRVLSDHEAGLLLLFAEFIEVGPNDIPVGTVRQ